MRRVAGKISAEVFLAEARGACDALRDSVIMAVSEEQSTLLHAEIPCSLTVEMEDPVTTERKGVFSRNGLTASRTVGDSQCLTPEGEHGSTRRLSPPGNSPSTSDPPSGGRRCGATACSTAL